MKKILLLLSVGVSSMQSARIIALQQETPEVEYFTEIATQYNSKLPDLWNSLTPQERVFAYYMTRASMPGNRIMADQTHRDALEITDLFRKVISEKQAVRKACGDVIDVESFLSEAELFFTYLSAHHGQYFLREFENHKRTPAKLKLTVVTPENLVVALQAVGVADAQGVVNRLERSIFDAEYEPTLVVEGDLEKSAGNIYSADFTQADFDSMAPEIKSALNAYFYIDSTNSERKPTAQFYKIGCKYGRELDVAHFWLNKACEHAQSYPDLFDEHIPKSLVHLLNYLQTGVENYFREFSIEWLKTTSRIDFNFGFIETYHDPLQYRGSFEADVTIKTMDMKKLNALLPSIEKELPFPEEFKRQNLDDPTAIPNASVNAKIFASGDAGPVKITAAYCLPNYTDIRSEYGSKQIMYQAGKKLGEQLNPELARNLFNMQERAEWLKKHDADMQLEHDLWDVQVVLHETLGHGSGRGATHTFVAGDPLVIGSVTYAIGDTMPVTRDTATEFFGGYSAAFEELRAEILALYTSVYNFDALAKSGFYKEWPAKIGKEKLTEWFVLAMVRCGLHRLLGQADDAQEIVQAHARADTAIMNYLLDHGGLEMVEEVFYVDDSAHTVVDVRVTDLQKALQAIKEMACEVQRCTSTADGQGVELIMKTYGTCVRYPEYIKILKANRRAVQGDITEALEMFPRLKPVLDEQGHIIDISATWPMSFIEQQLELDALSLSKE